MFSNLDYLYDHLPARIRRDDDGLLLKRFLTFAGEQLDRWDEQFDNFHQQVNSQTASDEFVTWWLWSLFGWSWFPDWYSLERKRQLYADFATLLARRGTARGIEEFLRAFSVHARVFNQALCFEEAYFGEDWWAIDGPLGVVVQVSHLSDEVNFDLAAIEEAYFEESHHATTRPTLSVSEIENLISFQCPLSHRVMIEYQSRRTVAGPEAWDRLPLDENQIPDENSGFLEGD